MLLREFLNKFRQKDISYQMMGNALFGEIQEIKC